MLPVGGQAPGVARLHRVPKEELSLLTGAMARDYRTAYPDGREQDELNRTPVIGVGHVSFRNILPSKLTSTSNGVCSSAIPLNAEQGSLVYNN